MKPKISPISKRNARARAGCRFVEHTQATCAGFAELTPFVARRDYAYLCQRKEKTDGA